MTVFINDNQFVLKVAKMDSMVDIVGLIVADIV